MRDWLRASSHNQRVNTKRHIIFEINIRIDGVFTGGGCTYRVVQ